MEWLAALLMFTGAWIWIWSAVFFFVSMAFSENDKNFFAFVSLGAFMALMYNAGQITLSLDPMTLAMYFVMYFAAGGIWSFLKWASFVNKAADRFGEIKIKFIEKINRDQPYYTDIVNADQDAEPLILPLESSIKTTIPKGLQDKFLKHIEDNVPYTTHQYIRSEGIKSIIPSAMTHKERIVTWILWWPTSAFWTILNDPLVRLANWMYSKFQGLYKRIANRAFAKYEL